MANNVKTAFLAEFVSRYGNLKKIGSSHSLFDLENQRVRLYIRYSRTYERGLTWFGLREIDLLQLEGHTSFLCFLWEGQIEPLLIPFSEYEEVFRSVTPADDGQFKVQIQPEQDGTRLYIARAGWFNVDGFFGWGQIDYFISTADLSIFPDLSHSQIQTLLGAIGSKKDFDVWIPPDNQPSLDWRISNQFPCREIFPSGYERIESILHKVDVIWIKRGSAEMSALFEIEHSTPIYSGLLRFNDLHLVAPSLRPRFSIVSNDQRRSLFVRQVSRPTFQMSGLTQICTFLEYLDVYHWHRRLFKKETNHDE